MREKRAVYTKEFKLDAVEKDGEKDGVRPMLLRFFHRVFYSLKNSQKLPALSVIRPEMPENQKPPFSREKVKEISYPERIQFGEQDTT